MMCLHSSCTQPEMDAAIMQLMHVVHHCELQYTSGPEPNYHCSTAFMKPYFVDVYAYSITVISQRLSV